MKKTVKIGSIKNTKDGRKVLHVFGDHNLTLKSGDYLNIKSKKEQLAEIDKRNEEGKFKDEESYMKARSYVEKIPDYILGELFVTIET